MCGSRGSPPRSVRSALAALVRLRGSPPRAAAAAALAFFSRPASPSGAALGRPAAGRRVVCRLFGAWWVAPCSLLLLLRFLRFVRSWLPLLRRGCVACLRRVPGFAAVRCLSGCPCLLLFSGRPRCLSCSLLLGRGLVSSRLLSPVSLLLLPLAPPGLSSSGSWCWLPRWSSAVCGGRSCSGECGGAGAGGAGGRGGGRGGAGSVVDSQQLLFFKVRFPLRHPSARVRVLVTPFFLPLPPNPQTIPATAPRIPPAPRSPCATAPPFFPKFQSRVSDFFSREIFRVFFRENFREIFMHAR